jgi:hypothetical protein
MYKKTLLVLYTHLQKRKSRPKPAKGQFSYVLSLALTETQRTFPWPSPAHQVGQTLENLYTGSESLLLVSKLKSR